MNRDTVGVSELTVDGKEQPVWPWPEHSEARIATAITTVITEVALHPTEPMTV